MSRSRKQITFDLDTKALEYYYINVPEAYYDIRNTLENMGFVHRQGSVYETKKAITDITLARKIDKLCDVLPWLYECSKDIVQTDITETHSLMKKAEKCCLKRENERDLWERDTAQKRTELNKPIKHNTEHQK